MIFFYCVKLVIVVVVVVVVVVVAATTHTAKSAFYFIYLFFLFFCNKEPTKRANGRKERHKSNFNSTRIELNKEARWNDDLVTAEDARVIEQ